MQNTLIDAVGSFSIQLFRGNAFHFILQIPENVVLPSSVELRSYYSDNLSTLLKPSLQGTATIDAVNRTLTIQYPKGDYPLEGYVQLVWSSRVVGAGRLSCNTNTSSRTGSIAGIVQLLLEPGALVSLPFTGDYLTAQFRDQAEASAVLAEQKATEATVKAQEISNKLGSILLYGGTDSQGIVTLVAGDNITIQPDNSGPYPSVILTLP